jgi:hypothetical protein
LDGTSRIKYTKRRLNGSIGHGQASLFLTQITGSVAYHAYILAQNAALADYIPDSRGLAVATGINPIATSQYRSTTVLYTRFHIIFSDCLIVK